MPFFFVLENFWNLEQNMHVIMREKFTKLSHLLKMQWLFLSTSKTSEKRKN